MPSTHNTTTQLFDNGATPGQVASALGIDLELAKSLHKAHQREAALLDYADAWEAPGHITMEDLRELV